MPRLSVTIREKVKSPRTFGAVNVGFTTAASLKVTVVPPVCIH